MLIKILFGRFGSMKKFKCKVPIEWDIIDVLQMPLEFGNLEEIEELIPH